MLFKRAFFHHCMLVPEILTIYIFIYLHDCARTKATILRKQKIEICKQHWKTSHLLQIYFTKFYCLIFIFHFQEVANNLRKMSFSGHFLFRKDPNQHNFFRSIFFMQFLLKINLKFQENIWKPDKPTSHAIMYLTNFFHVLVVSCCLFLLLGYFRNQSHDSFSVSFRLNLMDIHIFLKSSNLVF